MTASFGTKSDRRTSSSRKIAPTVDDQLRDKDIVSSSTRSNYHCCEQQTERRSASIIRFERGRDREREEEKIFLCGVSVRACYSIVLFEVSKQDSKRRSKDHEEVNRSYRKNSQEIVIIIRGENEHFQW